jgi:2-keto-4-pentenoate hydratase/2-oxohepta-3-ene-1,7-dioic acid hydratase in catechol pathway
LKLAHYLANGVMRVGIVEKDQVFDLQEAQNKLQLVSPSLPLTIDEILAVGVLGTLQRAEDRLIKSVPGKSLSETILRSPIINPEKILLLAVNYLSHSKEKKVEPPRQPYLFTKFRNALIGPQDPILLPRVSSRVDWEVELAVIIGRSGKNISKKDSLSHVAGYAVANDISFRDLQYSTRLPDGKTILGLNWVKGKGLDSSFALGPWLVTSDEVPDPQALGISLSVNGNVKQKSSTTEMVFRIDSIIEYASAGMTLRAGDVISTGTPEGVAAFTGGSYLKEGDMVEASVERIGTLRNPVRTELP